MTLLLFSGSGSARAGTLIVSNQLQTRGNVPVFVTCEEGMSKSVPLGKMLLREIPTIAGNNTTDGSREQQYMCLGTFYSVPRSRPTVRARPYIL
ncbi:unnamed protein product [Microthlaspi erraticum]|uniref:Uncharacterized protein n=1 Tax=Microthlaspi erraticum TaxID=1685480 RepID=A0A6D2IHD9_9BRAS|nr:unnamed protein product [Microthlaspi erraticum]